MRVAERILISGGMNEVHSFLFFQIFYAMGIQWGWFLTGC
jgi:hypothetical protein